MSSIKTILVGIDYSKNSENALREASRIANWNDANLVCLHILEEEIVQAFRAAEPFDEVAMRRQAQSRLEEHVADTVGTGHDIDCRVHIGRPFSEVVAAIEFTNPDLLVLGSHGLSSDDPGHVGALARRCVRRLPIDVLLVQERQNEPFKRIVACIDFSSDSMEAAHRAAEIASQDQAVLELLHVYRNAINAARDGGGFGPSLPEVDTTEIVRKLEVDLEEFAEDLADAHGGCEIRTRVDERSVVSRGIVQRLEESDADLVVLGTKGKTGLKELVIGTTAERLIYRVPCSALAVKSRS